VLSPQLDVKNKKILYELSKNSRIPATRLAKLVGISREVADYRIKNLVSSGIITSFITDIDISKLNCTRYLIYLELHKVNETEETQILKTITSNPYVSWTTSQTGKWNVIFDVIAKDISCVDTIVKDLKTNYSDKISDYKIATQLEYRHYYSKYFGEEPKTTTPIKPHNLDPLDLKLLNLLSKDARINYAKLSQTLNLTANTIKARIRTLKAAGIIKRFTIQVSKPRLGYQPYNLQLTFKDTTPGNAERFLKYIKSHPNVNFYYLPLGHWDLELGLFVKDPNHLRRIILDIRNKYSDIIRIYDCMIFYEELKPNYVPVGAISP